MKKFLSVLCAVLVVFLGLPPVAMAHTRSESHSSWQINGTTIRLQFTIPDLESQRLTPNGAMPTEDQEGRYVADHVAAYSGEAPCTVKDGPRYIRTTPGYRRYEFSFECPSEAAIKVESSAFFELVASHTNFAQIQTADGKFAEQLITKDEQSVEVSAISGESPLQDASFFDYVWMGMMHIFTGYDHQSFLLGLVILSRRLRDLLFVVTGFTIGHSITLAIATLGLFRPVGEFLDPLVGLTIALVGAEAASNNTGKPLWIAAGLAVPLAFLAGAHAMGFGALPLTLLLGAAIFAPNYLMISNKLQNVGRFRLMVTLIFGLIHGFTFAKNLYEMNLPQGRMAELLAGFNIGVELGQLSVVAVILTVTYILIKTKLHLPRPIVTDVVSALVVGMGMYWFVGRAFPV